MDDAIRELIEKARKGKPEDGLALGTALRRVGAPLELLLELAEAIEEPLRIAAADASRGREEPALYTVLRELALDPSVAVRTTLARAIHEQEHWPLPDNVLQPLVSAREDSIQKLVVGAAASREALFDGVRACVVSDASWELREEAARALAKASPHLAIPLCLTRITEDDDFDVILELAIATETHLVGGDDGPAWPEGVTLPEDDVLGKARVQCAKLAARRIPRLLKLLGSYVSNDLNLKALRSVASDLTQRFQSGSLPHSFEIDAHIDRALEVLTEGEPRALVLLGEAGVGKTAIVHGLVARLAQDKAREVHVFRMAPSEILVGTLYLGEWQTKLQKVISNAKHPKPVVLYIPNVEQLVHVGRTSKSDQNAATMLMPHIASGDIAVIAESTPHAFQTALTDEPSFRRLFKVMDVPSATEDATREIGTALCGAAGFSNAGPFVDRVIELAGFMRQSVAEPGRSLDLLREALAEAAAEGATELSDHLAIAAASKTTGVPQVILDDRARLDLEATRTFLASRVMGQPAAVDAMLDLVTLVKAGMTDPNKPYGVFLFVGPTGVGKTEMARALAEFLFGSPAKLQRFDMSEYATYDAFERLLGNPRRKGLLTRVVQEDPFSVILLDEIEKGHVNVFDLCLQLFDAGRLTDGSGQPADFRRSIIIMTSNAGSALPTEAAVGFGDRGPVAPDDAAIKRALRNTFRPEFIGRLDRVVSFRPLAPETAERIVRREAARILERRGIRRRGLQVDVDPSVVAYLLQMGYSATLGARPLKQTIERELLMPLARAVARGRIPQGSIVRLALSGERITIQVDRERQVPRSEGAPLRSPPLEARIQALVEGLPALEALASGVEARRRALLETSRQHGFWDDAPTAREVLGEIHRTDTLVTAMTRLARRVRDTAGHVASADKAQQAELGTRLDSLERETARLQFLLRAPESLLRDAYVCVRRVAFEGEALHAVPQIARMVMGYAKRHGLDVHVLGECTGSGPQDPVVWLGVAGLGAFGMLAPEAGLHQLRHTVAGSARRRALVRIDVWPEDARASDDQALRIQTRQLRGESGHLIKRPTLALALMHEPSLTSLDAWTDQSRAEALAQLEPCILAMAAAGGVDADPSLGPVVRRYELGSAPLVRDRRSGRSTGRVAEVLAGDLDRLRDFAQLANEGARPVTGSPTSAHEADEESPEV